MENLEIAKKLIRENIHLGLCGIFDTSSNGDYSEIIYCDGGLTIILCHEWECFEVFGLEDEEFEELEEYYDDLRYGYMDEEGE